MNLADSEVMASIMQAEGFKTTDDPLKADVVFLNKKHTVVGLMADLAPFRISPVHFSGYSVLELPSGTIKKSRTEIGDQFEISLVETSAMDDLKDTRLSQIG